ncbi:MAG: beta-xylosidase [Clostridia bacterium]|nr:beta-xylosidase [Clostridia bacterium]
MAEKVWIHVDASREIGPFARTWNYIGYDECNYTHSPGGIALIKKFGQLPRSYYMRAHHMLCTGILHGFYKWGSTNAYTEDENGNPIHNFDLIDEMCDIWLGNGAKPFFELGFMPRDLADPRASKNGKYYQMAYGVSEYQLVGWSMPPKDYTKWYDLIYALVAHCTARYGADEVESWYFEMWNEPDISYWRGTHDEFCKLYDFTEAAVHAALPTARFGGPATCGNRTADGSGSVFLDAFLKHIRDGKNYYSGARGTRIDFTSFHTKGGGYQFDTLARKQIPSVKVFLENVRTQFEVILKHGFGDLECVLSEADPDGWAAGGRFDNFNLNFRNTEYYASYTASAYKNLYDLADSMRGDIRPLAWAFMFEGERCFEGTRTFSTQGIDKPMLNLFRLFEKLGDTRVAFESSRDVDPLSFADDNGTEEGPEIDGWATVRDGAVQLLMYCHHDDWDVKRTYDVSLSITGLPFSANARVTHYRIDANHSNAYTEWVRQGQPNYPVDGQYAAIKAHDALAYESPRSFVPTKDGKLSLAFPLPTHAVSMLIIEQA